MKTITFSKLEWLILAIIAFPVILIAVYWNKFPDTIATHFDIHGKPNDYSSKAFGLLITPVMSAVLYLFLIFLPLLDPKKENYKLFAEKYKVIRLIFHLLFSYISCIIIFYSLGFDLKMDKLIIGGVLCLFLALGNYMGNIRQNYFIGIRTPWTLANEQVWILTHRFSAKIWVAAAIVGLILLFAVPVLGPVIAIAPVILAAIASVVYSFVKFKQLKQ